MSQYGRCRSLVERQVSVNESNVFGPIQSFEDANKTNGEILEFVKTFLKYLAKPEGQNSTLHVFCRVDVGVFIEKPNVVSYFVNEVERGITTSLWVADGPHTVGMVGASIVGPLKRWIAMEKARLGAVACGSSS